MPQFPCELSSHATVYLLNTSITPNGDFCNDPYCHIKGILEKEFKNGKPYDLLNSILDAIPSNL